MTHRLFNRALHQREKRAILDVPDNAQRVHIAFKRHVTASPTGWTNHEHTMTWHVRQWVDESVVEGMRDLLAQIDASEIAAGNKPASKYVRDQHQIMLRQLIGTWQLLGSDTARGGIWSDIKVFDGPPDADGMLTNYHFLTAAEGAIESTESFNEHGLLPGKNRKIRVDFEVHKGQIDTEAVLEWL